MATFKKKRGLAHLIYINALCATLLARTLIKNKVKTTVTISGFLLIYSSPGSFLVQKA